MLMVVVNLVRSKSAPSVTLSRADSVSPDLPHTAAPSPSPAPENVNGKSPAAATGPPKSPVTPSKPMSKPKRGGSEKSDKDSTTQSTPPVNVSTSRSSGTRAATSSSRRNSWISSLSSKFSSGSTPPSQSHMKDAANASKQSTQSPRPDQTKSAFSPKDKDDKGADTSLTATSGSPKSNPSFFHNALRRLSSGNSGLGKLTTQGVVSQRRVMNIDPNRDRCKIPELNQAKLRRVAFCVDVEIAGMSRRSESEEDGKSGRGKHSSFLSRDKTKSSTKDAEKGEADALKAGEPVANGGAGNVEAGSPESKPPEPPKDDEKPSSQTKEPTRRQEKKKKSEEERKERKEKKRRQAEANGSIPLQFTRDGDGSNSPVSHRSPKSQDQPTTDPVRIYRRCCQLRESGVLKKLVELMSSSSSVLAESPGTVAVLDLTGFWMTLQDVVTFSDWLAIVPVRKLILQNCGLTDEAVRIILAGLLSTTTMEESRNRRYTSRKPNDEATQGGGGFGAIEKLSLKDNPKIGPEGWRHISLFIHMSRSLKGIDLSGVPFPKAAISTNGPTSPTTKAAKPAVDISTVFANALAERFAKDQLEELVLSECYPSTEALGKICDAARTVGLRRLGVANNALTKEGLEHVVGYFKAGSCEGLDLGGNAVNDHLGFLASAVTKEQPLSALSLADCSLSPKTLCTLLQALTNLPNFRFIDLSHNPTLFANQPDSLAILRRYLPQIPELKRIHLVDVNLSSDHAIALAEILPDCSKLCHINILENAGIQALAAATDAASQEEACALYASLMTATRISHTLIAVDIDVPSADNNEVVKALASQIVAYSLHNLERGELVGEFSASSDDTASKKNAVPFPDILLHIVGHDGSADDLPSDTDPAPDEDYVIGGTGVVKALGVCLGNANHSALEHLGDMSPTPSGASTPLRRPSSAVVNKKARDMAKDLLNSARKIRVRLQPALVREDRAGNDLNYRRLQFLDFTLQRMIQRFEDEFPDTRLPPEQTPQFTPPQEGSRGSSLDETPAQLGAVGDETTAPSASALGRSPDDDDTDQYAVRLSRTSSNTSLHARALMSEEGQLHRFSQNFRRDIIGPELENPVDEPSSPSAVGASGAAPQLPDEARIAALREKLEILRSSEMQSRIETVGPDKVLEELGSSLQELLVLQEKDPEAFETFKESQIAAQINAGLRGWSVDSPPPPAL
ncbi:hypothetical protein AJ80_04751 [Polytolypa hystricis UAMH7299]|uniref:Cell wall biogenesis protein Mhp1 n=1 Tax=Polytolypa hystricis (strain UAMH7299) TaxID=1447883 RepID=A0A2B7Y958_POLH7|nr:hypothetical protein AJ80_04751 [Polytolypa hystricis UAMH7299]